MTRTAKFWQEINRRPGMFQGEPNYVEAFHKAAMKGFADDATEDYDVFLLSDTDRAAYGFDAADYALVLWVDDQGFVHHLLFDSQDAYESWWSGVLANEIVTGRAGRRLLSNRLQEAIRGVSGFERVSVYADHRVGGGFSIRVYSDDVAEQLVQLFRDQQ